MSASFSSISNDPIPMGMFRQPVVARSEASGREAAEEFVSLALVEPVLKQLRESSQAAAPFGPSEDEGHFASLLDAAMSKRIVRASGWDLVDRVADSLTARADAMKEAGLHG